MIMAWGTSNGPQHDIGSHLVLDFGGAGERFSQVTGYRSNACFTPSTTRKRQPYKIITLNLTTRPSEGLGFRVIFGSYGGYVGLSRLCMV